MGIPPIDLSEEEGGLVNDFEEFSNKYNKYLEKNLRNNLKNSYYVLYHHLKQRGIDIPSGGKIRMRTVAMKRKHNKIMEERFRNLGWVFIKD